MGLQEPGASPFLTVTFPAALFLPSTVTASLWGGLDTNHQYLLHD